MSTRTLPSPSRHRAAARIALAASAPLLLLGTDTALASTDAELGAKVRECVSIRRDKARLRCFDEALSPPPAAAASATADPTPATAATPPAPAAAAPAAEPPAATADAQDEFGREQIDPPEPKAPETQQIEALVSALDKRRDGLLTITLDNDQVWRQKSVTSLFRLRVGDQITVRKGRFGGYVLVAPGRKSTAVTRVR